MNKPFITIFCLTFLVVSVLSGCNRPTPTPFSEPTDTFAIGWLATKTPILTATPTQAATPTQMATLTATSAPTSATSCADAPAIRLTANSWAHVSLVPPLSSNVRKEPGLEAERVSRLAPGQIVWVMEGPRCADGYAWWLVRDSDYQQGWTAEGDGENYWLLPSQDSFFYNTDQPSASSHMVLTQGQSYHVTLSGTYSLWVRAQWTDAGVCIRGNFEVAPLFPTVGKENGPVGADAYARFARPFYGPCATTYEPGETISQIQLSTDGGVTFALAVPVIAQYRPDHTYVYEVKGHGYPLSIRLDDAVLQDNYGQILVLIEKVE